MENGYEKRGYLLDAFRLFHLKDSSGAKFNYHYHEFYKLLFLRSGSGGYSVAGQRYTLEAGDVVLVGSQSIHRPEFEKGMLYERVIIYISPQFLEMHSTENCRLSEIFDGKNGHVLHLSNPAPIWALSDALEQELAENNFGRELRSNSLLLMLFIEIARSMQHPKATFVAPLAPADSRIAELLRYIDAHLSEELSIEHLAEQLYLSRFHMMRLFRQETGQSIHSYLQQRRLLHAAELIKQGVSATESCFLSGFGSYSAFTRAYAKHFGTTPTGRKTQFPPAEETYE